MASPHEGEQGVGGVWVFLALSDLSCFQPGQGFLRNFHLGICLRGSDSKLDEA